MSTNIIAAEDTIIGLFEQLCDWQTASVLTIDKSKEIDEERIGMLFTLQVDCDNYGYEKDGNTLHEDWERHYRKYVHIVVLRGRRVFVAKSDELDWKSVNPIDFKNTSNHYSCWRSDGLQMIWETYIDSYNQCYKTQDPPIPEEHRKPPIAANISGSFIPLLRKVLTYVKVDWEWDRQEEYHGNYWRKLTNISEVKFKVVLDV